MKRQLSISDSIYYFDTNALWKFYYGQENYLKIRRLVASSSSQILVSPLTMIEFVGVLMKYHRKKPVKRKHVNAIIRRMRRDVGTVNRHRPFRVDDLPENVFREAESILLRCGDNAIQTIDALHLAVVVRLDRLSTSTIVLVTSDGPLLNAAQKSGVNCYDPEAN